MVSFSTVGGSSPDGVTLDYDANENLSIKDLGVGPAKFNASTQQIMGSIYAQLAFLAGAALDTLIVPDFSGAYIDGLTTSTGVNGTVDTGNSTMGYDETSLGYTRYGVAVAADAGFTLSNTSSQTVKRGFKINTNAAVIIHSVTKHASCTATTCYVTDAAGSVLATQAFSGDVATFATPAVLADATDYFVLVDSGGASYTDRSIGSISYPVTGDLLDITAGAYDGILNVTNAAYELLSITARAVFGTGQALVITLPTISETVDRVMLVLLTNGDAGTPTFSITDGAETDTGIALNTIHTLANLTANPTSMTITGAGTISIHGYALFVWEAA